ncbi:MAG TPA: ATP-grasp domain-containing protein [Acidimicrobiales bacterium]|nr:ATP-grasp domain-containing protein [Acidimicrobiales bacterium]
MPRVLLLLPTATYKATDFLEAADRLGVEVVVGSERQQALAGVMGDRFVLVPLDDPDVATAAIVDHAARTSFDAVLAVDDQGVLAAAKASAALGLPHSPPEAVAVTRNKLDMRTALDAHGVPQPRHRTADPRDPVDVANCADAIGYPVVLKPLRLSASRGVIRADDRSAAIEAGGRIGALLFGKLGDVNPRILVEEYLEGDEVAVEGLLTNGALEVLAIFDKPDPLIGPYFEETIYVTPSRHPAALQAEIGRVTQLATRALGLTEGPVHAELRVDAATGSPRIIEVAARTIGGRCAAALRFASGATLEEIVIAHALGIERGDAPAREASAAGVMMLPIPRTGRLVAVDGREDALAVPGVTGLDITATVGHRLEALPEGDRYLGFLFARGATPDEAEESLRRGYRALSITID